MTDCPDGAMRDLLPDLLHGSLDPRTAGRVQAHAAECADCRAELALLGAARAALRHAPGVDVPAIVGCLPRAGTTATTTAGRGTSARLPRRNRPWRLAAAAAALLAVGGATAVVATRPRATTPPQMASGAPVVQPTASPELPAATPDSPSAPAVAPRTAEIAAPELSLVASTAELTDAELEALLGDLEALDAVPSADPESVSPVVSSSEGA